MESLSWVIRVQHRAVVDLQGSAAVVKREIPSALRCHMGGWTRRAYRACRLNVAEAYYCTYMPLCISCYYVYELGVLLCVSKKDS